MCVGVRERVSVDDFGKQMRKAQQKLEVAERREDWVTVLFWDRVIDTLSQQAADARAGKC